MEDIELLTDRETEILKLVAEGKSNKEIAHILTISINTVKVHVRSIFNKLDVVSRTEAAMWAVQNRLIHINDSGDEAQQSNLNTETNASGTSGTEITTYLRPGWLVFFGLTLLLLIIVSSRIFLSSSETPPATLDQAAFIESLEETRWKQSENMPTPRYGLATALFDKKIFAIGGENSEEVTGITEIFDPESNSWQTAAAKPTPVSEAQAGVIGGKIFVPGGLLQNGEPTAVMEVYDPRSNTWSTAASMPDPLRGYAMATFEGKLYVFGGWDLREISSVTLMYDPGIDQWTKMSPMPTARSFAAAAESGGKIFVLGGFDGENALSINEVYDVNLDNNAENPWSQGVAMPVPLYQHGVARAGENLVVMGGLTESTSSSGIFEFSVTNLSWNNLSNPFTGTWWGMGVVSSGTQIFRVGGRINDEPVSDTFSYTAYYTILMPIIEK